MAKKIKVLWIEDQASKMLSEYTGPVVGCGYYALDIAESISEALKMIKNKHYDILIFDIRMDPGNNQDVANWFFRHGGDKYATRLGMELAKLLFIDNLDDPLIKGYIKPEWLTPENVGFLTVESESETKDELESMKIKHYRQKTVKAGKRILLDLLDEISRRIP